MCLFLLLPRDVIDLKPNYPYKGKGKAEFTMAQTQFEL